MRGKYAIASLLLTCRIYTFANSSFFKVIKKHMNKFLFLIDNYLIMNNWLNYIYNWFSSDKSVLISQSAISTDFVINNVLSDAYFVQNSLANFFKITLENKFNVKIKSSRDIYSTCVTYEILHMKCISYGQYILIQLETKNLFFMLSGYSFTTIHK